ncbi:MAG: hypothetical protein TREMPRED_000356 [Tremellales sp. Tagirdzhanova-0007]|nr:MAG: hypothetical protein TREMPRED_000356 [Tremellales sp. Tagirdzhanova-0007]
MPLQARRPNLPAISLPSQIQTKSLLAEDVHTPIPFTPIPYSSIPFNQVPLVMTPDTPHFTLPPLDVAVAAIRSNDAVADNIDVPWTDDQDGILQSYLMHPPHQLRTSYPPGSLPPPNALDEITTQILAMSRPSPSAASSSTSTAWKHSWESTRARLFGIARAESMSAIGGHKRDKSESLTIIPIPASMQPKLSVLGGASMNRQQHSMDSLYGEENSQGFSETLRLSNTLQVSAARDSGSVLTSGDGLSSPLPFCFNSSNPSGRKAGFPFPAGGLPRPASLLQRGKSFTSEDFPLYGLLATPKWRDFRDVQG